MDRGVQLNSEVDSSFGEQDQGSEDDGFDDLHNSESGSNGQRNKERNMSQLTLQYSNFDSSEVPSTTGVNSPHTYSPHGSLQGYQGGGGTSEECRSSTSPNKQKHRRTLSSSAAPIDVLIKVLNICKSLRLPKTFNEQKDMGSHRD
ncbi:unnamed protein product [Sphagnum balticum]